LQQPGATKPFLWISRHQMDLNRTTAIVCLHTPYLFQAWNIPPSARICTTFHHGFTTVEVFFFQGMCLQRHPSLSHHFPGFRHCRRLRVSMRVSHLHLFPPCVFPCHILLEHVQILIQLFSVANTSRPVTLRPVLHLPPGQRRRDEPSLRESGLLKLGRASKAAKKKPRKQQPPHQQTNKNNPSQSGKQSPLSLGTASVVHAEGTSKATRGGSGGKSGDVCWHYTHYTQYSPQENGTANQSIWIPYK